MRSLIAILFLLLVPSVAAAQEPLPGKLPVVAAIREAYCPGLRSNEPCQALASSAALKHAFVKDVAAATGLGLVKKNPPHTNCLGYSCDFVCSLDGTFGYDILIDQETAARPSWTYKRSADPAALARSCVRLSAGTTPTPPAPKPPTSPTCADTEALFELLASLEQRLERIERQTAQAAHESLQGAVRAAEIQTQLAAHDQNLTEHRQVAQEELRKAKSWGSKLFSGVIRILPGALAALGGYLAK